MDITQIIIVCFIGVVMITVLGSENKEYGTYIRIAVAVTVFFAVFTKLSAVVSVFQDIVSRANISGTYIEIIFKIIGIAYLAEIGSNICKDANEAAIASKIEFAGKIMIILIATPIITAIMDQVSNFFV